MQVPREAYREVSSAAAPKPRWGQLPQMQQAEFLHGLRQRNWTSPHFRADSQPWKVRQCLHTLRADQQCCSVHAPSASAVQLAM